MIIRDSYSYYISLKWVFGRKFCEQHSCEMKNPDQMRLNMNTQKIGILKLYELSEFYIVQFNLTFHGSNLTSRKLPNEPLK